MSEGSGRPDHYNKYSDVEKGLALAAVEANGGNVSKTAKQLGIPRLTLLFWTRGVGIHPDTLKNQLAQKVSLADRLEAVAHCLITETVNPKKLKQANVLQVATAMAIAVDKMRLLRGEATTITSKVSNPDEFLDKLQDFTRRIRRGRGRELGGDDGRAAGGGGGLLAGPDGDGPAEERLPE